MALKDDDGVNDSVDECPLEGKAEPDNGEILNNGCIRQSQCSDGIDNNQDGVIDYPNDQSCVNIIDDSEDSVNTDD